MPLTSSHVSQIFPSAVSDGIVRSARNRFTGLVVRVERDGLTAIVEIQAGSHRIVSLMTRDAADELALEVGDLATNRLQLAQRRPRARHEDAVGE